MAMQIDIRHFARDEPPKPTGRPNPVSLMSRRKLSQSQNSVAREFEKYFKQIKLLNRLLDDTLDSFDEINANGYFDFEDAETPIDIIEDENIGIAELLKKSPNIVIIGQDLASKASVLKQMLGEEIIPISYTYGDENGDEKFQRKVRIKYGKEKYYGLCLNSLSNEYDYIDTRHENMKTDWTSLPEEELFAETEDSKSAAVFLDVRLQHSILREGAEITVCGSTNKDGQLPEFVSEVAQNSFPVVIYALNGHRLNPAEMKDLRDIKTEVQSDLPIFFIQTFCAGSPTTSNPAVEEMTESLQDEEKDAVIQQLIGLNFLTDDDIQAPSNVQIIDLDELSDEGEEDNFFSNRKISTITDQVGIHALSRGKFDNVKVEIGSKYVEKLTEVGKFNDFLQKNLRSHLVKLSTLLHNSHTYCLKTFVATAYDLSRDCQITPKRLEYTKQRELELFYALMNIANQQLPEIRKTIHEVVHEAKQELLDEAAELDLEKAAVSGKKRYLRDYEGPIRNLVIKRLNKKIGAKLISSVNDLNDNYTGVLKRCLNLLENGIGDDKKFNNSSAQAALNRILDTAYNVELAYDSASFSLMERLRDLLSAFSGRPAVNMDSAWKRKTAERMIEAISEPRLARIIHQQFKNKLEDSHRQFLNAVKVLEERQAVKLEKNEQRRMQVRKNHAPKIARLAMEALSMRDAALYGMPRTRNEIGRGQYGIVFSCPSWGQWGPCAVKSLVPPDEKHWNDLAMEFYYTRSLPPHDRLVQLRGSVIDHCYSENACAALLIMDRYPRDLYAGLQSKTLKYWERLQVAADVVEGLRFLHNQGLVHRDIKLKNVLLDNENRGKITDLGFCKPEAMMGGSIVGTPIHMAPELFRGHYDSSVDTYAFGILFWYLCSGRVSLPVNFEMTGTKEQLWTAVQRGCRPERLPIFEGECWYIMDRCWAPHPSDRPYLGTLEPRLAHLIEAAKSRPDPPEPPEVPPKPNPRLIRRRTNTLKKEDKKSDEKKSDDKKQSADSKGSGEKKRSSESKKETNS